MGSIKVNRKTAERLINEGYTIKLIPCKVRLENLWIEPSYVTLEKLNEWDTNFEKFVNAYSYYNCNSELGNHLAYYLNVEFSLAGSVGSSCLGYKQAIKLYNELKNRYTYKAV